MSKQFAYIGAGTNLGNRLENLAFAAQLLPPTIKIIRTSAIYQTAPWGYSDQPDFFNLVWEVETTLPPQSLLSLLKSIERRMGREETVRYGPRIIDLDILLYGDMVYESESLTIPHPQLPNRRFVLQPLCELIPDQLHPQSGVSFDSFLQQVLTDRVEKLPDQLNAQKPIFRWGQKTYLMGIINLTHDSFSKDGLLNRTDHWVEQAVQQAGAFLCCGADILDLGAESTRPGFQPISANKEINVLTPVIQAVKQAFPHAILSVDTRKAAVAEAALTIGADWINDVGGGFEDPAMAAVCASAGCPFVLMRFQPLDKQIPTKAQVLNQFETLILHAISQGIQEENLILDPGIGFGTTPWQCLEILQYLPDFKALHRPILVGTSRKSFIGHLLQRDVEHRLGGTAATVAIAIRNGADIVRVHDVELISDMIKMTDLVIR